MQIKTIHGWDIYLSSRTGKFSAEKEDEESLSAETLEGITTEIERLRKASSKRLPFLEVNTGFGTHQQTDGGKSFDVWYSRKREEGKNDRGKWYSFPLRLIKPIESNKKLMEEYIELKKKKESFESQMKKKEEEFGVYSKKEILENFGFEYEEPSQ